MELVKQYVKKQVMALLIDMYLEDDRKEEVDNVAPMTAFQYLTYWNRIPDDLGDSLGALLNNSDSEGINPTEIHERLLEIQVSK